MANGTLAYYVDGQLQGVAGFGVPAHCVPFVRLTRAGAAVHFELAVDLPLTQPLYPRRPTPWLWSTALTCALASLQSADGLLVRISSHHLSPPLISSLAFALHDDATVKYWEIANVHAQNALSLLVGVFVHCERCQDDLLRSVVEQFTPYATPSTPFGLLAGGYAVRFGADSSGCSLAMLAASGKSVPTTPTTLPSLARFGELQPGDVIGMRFDSRTRWLDVFRRTSTRDASDAFK